MGEPSLRVDVIELACLDERVDGGGASGSGVRSGEGPVAAPDGHTAQCAFGGVVAEAYAPVVEEARERRPLIECVVDRLDEIMFGREARALLSQPCLQRDDQWLRAFLARGFALVGRLAIDGALDLE